MPHYFIFLRKHGKTYTSKLKYGFILILFVVSTHLLHAQFTITETFKGSSVGSNIILGGDPTTATLTSGNVDPVNNGWLRLTNDATNQRGFAYINTPFPSSMGIFLEFEYKTWRSKNDNYNGADGFTVFLFDANTSPFQIGAFGGSLGYAQQNTTPGLAGGYLGVGFDEYGNYAMSSEGKNGGTTALAPNSIVLRGPANHAQPYRYLTHKQLQTNSSTNGINSIDYNTTTPTRPTDATFYRRVKIYIDPIGTPSSPKYKIRVLWRTTSTGTDIEHISYDTTDPIPNMLKLGFGASTGGGFNFHEIRNLMITTTGGVRVKKEVDKVNAQPNSDLTYTINVYNESANPVSNLILNDEVRNGNETTINTNDFEITSITFNNNGNTGNTASGFTSGTAKTSELTNPFSTTMTLAAQSQATFTVVGRVKTVPPGGIVTNNVSLNVTNMTGVSDNDLTNNTASVSTTILNPNVDLKIEKGVNNNGIAITSGNTYTIVVSNLSSTDKPASKTVTVTDVIPTGLTVTGWSGTGWNRSVSGNTQTFTRSDALTSQYTYPPITITVTPSGVGPWTNTATLTYTDDTNAANNSSSVTLHWKNLWKGTSSTDWNTTGNWTANMVPLSGEDVEFATTANNPASNGPASGAALNNLVVPTGSPKTVGNLTNASDKNLIVPANASIAVNSVVSIKNPGTSTNSTDPSKIQIGSAANQPNGSFIFNCAAQSASLQPDIYATVELYAKGFKGTPQTWTDNINGSPTNGQTFTSSYHWQHFGVPVEAVQAEPNFYGSFLRQYYENQNWTVDPSKSSTFYAKWKDLGNSDVLAAFKGYEITQETAKKYYIPGKLVYCDKDIILTRKAPAVTNASGANVNYGLGQNIFGNSFTSAISIDKIVFPTNVESTVYLYNTGRFHDWTGGSTVTGEGQIAAGNYLSIPKNTAPAVWGNQIPSMQGFLLKFTAAETTFNGADATVSLKYANNGVTPNSKPQLAPGAVKTNALSSLQITLDSKTTRDELWLFSQEGTSNKFDNGWDGRKFFGTPTAFIYTDTPDGPMQVSSNSTIDGSTISFFANKDTDYTLTINKSNLDEYSNLHLLDLQTKTAIPLANEVTTYQFSANNTGTAAKRFLVVNSAQVDMDNYNFKLLDAYITSTNELVTTNYTGTNGIFNLYNTAGQFVIKNSLLTGIHRSSFAVNPGVYLLQMQAGSKSETVKIIVRN